MQKNDEKKMQFILSVRSKGVLDDNVLKAIESLNREHFLKGVFAQRAYEDTPLPIECGQTISKPSVVGIMTQALKITTRDKILEIGTGSGYQTDILSKLARRVYSVERFKPLYDEARQIFKKLNLNNITPIWGDGSQGIVEQQPFDRIIVTAAAEDPPPILLNQLKVGGIMIIPVGQSDEKLFEALARAAERRASEVNAQGVAKDGASYCVEVQAIVPRAQSGSS